MSASAAAICRTFAVGKFTCTITIPTPTPGVVGAMSAEWAPHLPKRLGKKEWRQYRAGRDAVVAELAALLGGPALVIEL